MILDGKPVAELITNQVRVELQNIPESLCLGIFANLQHPPSQLFVKKKVEHCASLGLEVEVIDVSQGNNLNFQNPHHNGIIVQLPCPGQQEMIRLIPPEKDVDGFHPVNLGNLISGNPTFVPCTALAVDKLLEYYQIDLSGKHVVIINDSIVMGKPLFCLLNQRKATVTVCNQYTKNLKEIIKSSEVVVSAVGKDFQITPDTVTNQHIVIDVGVKRVDNKTVGDLSKEAAEKVKAYTKSVGGVGIVTVAFVAANLLKTRNKK